MPNGRTRLRVAICDDEILIGLDFEDLTLGLGHTVCAVCGSAEAILGAVETHRPDLVLMDVKLGSDDGIETAALIRERYGIPSLLISGDGEALRSERAQRCRPLGLLMKPVSEQALESALRQAVQGWKRQG